MSDEPEKQPDEKEKSPSRIFLEEVAETLPYAKPIRKFVHREGKAIYDGFIVFGILAILLALYAFSKGYGFGASKLESVKGELKDAKQDRDKYQIMLAPFQAMAIKIYTNVPIEERMEFFTVQMSQSQSNILNALESEKPSFELSINDEIVTNGSKIYLKQPRVVRLTVANVSSVTAEQLQIDLETPSEIDKTNISAGFSWKEEPLSTVKNKDNSIMPSGYHWMAKSDFAIAPRHGFALSDLEISTNIPYSGMDVRFDVYAARSKLQTYRITLMF